MFRKIFLFMLCTLLFAGSAEAAQKHRAAPATQNGEQSSVQPAPAASTQTANQSAQPDKAGESGNSTKPAQESAKAAVMLSGKPLVLNMTLGDPQSSEMGFIGESFKKEIEERSQRTIRVNLTYAAGMGEDESFQFHKVQTGKSEMAVGGIANLVPMVRDLGVLTLPYLFANTDEVVKGITGKAGELLNSYAQQANLRILAWMCCGYRYISNSKHPITTMEDMRGLRFRVPQSTAMIQTYRAFGGIPSTISWGMTFNALNHDEVDGQCYDYTGFKAMNFAMTGQKFITEIHYLYSLQPMVISEQLFQSLTDDQQQLLLDIGQHVQQLSLQYQEEQSDKVKEELMRDGIQISTLQDENLWREKARSTVWAKVAGNMGGKQTINNYLEACGLPLWE